MYIAYDIKNGKFSVGRTNGAVYAKLCVSRRTGKTTAKDYINLGRVIDKKHGIYKNRERGVFTYSIEDNAYGKPDASVILPESLSARREKLILDFGDTFFLDAYVRKIGLRPSIDAIGYTNPDTLYSMICCYILCSAANCQPPHGGKGIMPGLCILKPT